MLVSTKTKTKIECKFLLKLKLKAYLKPRVIASSDGIYDAT